VLLGKRLEPRTLRPISFISNAQCVIPADSRQAILPDALRVNANLFQTDLYRNPEAKDGKL
jgi:hypothetical protein